MSGVLGRSLGRVLRPEGWPGPEPPRQDGPLTPAAGQFPGLRPGTSAPSAEAAREPLISEGAQPRDVVIDVVDIQGDQVTAQECGGLASGQGGSRRPPAAALTSPAAGPRALAR